MIDYQELRKKAAERSIETQTCMVCEDDLAGADDVLEGVLIAAGPSRLVVEDVHFLAHHDCVAGYLQRGDAATA